MKTIRIGCGAGFAGDRIEPAVDLATHGALDVALDGHGKSLSSALLEMEIPDED